MRPQKKYGGKKILSQTLQHRRPYHEAARLLVCALSTNRSQSAQPADGGAQQAYSICILSSQETPQSSPLWSPRYTKAAPAGASHRGHLLMVCISADGMVVHIVNTCYCPLFAGCVFLYTRVAIALHKTHAYTKTR